MIIIKAVVCVSGKCGFRSKLHAGVFWVSTAIS